LLPKKADNAFQVKKLLTPTLPHPVSTKTRCQNLSCAGMKAVVKVKCPLFTAKHCKACLDWALAHQSWIIEDWKRVVWSDETKINHLGSDGRKWGWKKKRESLSDTVSWFLEL
jgi:hypothetical protein